MLTERTLVPILAALALTGANDPPPPPGGALGTLELGRYDCELPSPEDVTRGRAVANAEFHVVTTSSYRTDGIIGSYLRTGDEVVFSSGPRHGERYRVIGSGQLQALAADGSPTRMRCLIVGSRKR